MSVAIPPLHAESDVRNSHSQGGGPLLGRDRHSIDCSCHAQRPPARTAVARASHSLARVTIPPPRSGLQTAARLYTTLRLPPLHLRHLRAHPLGAAFLIVARHLPGSLCRFYCAVASPPLLPWLLPLPSNHVRPCCGGPTPSRSSFPAGGGVGPGRALSLCGAHLGLSSGR